LGAPISAEIASAISSLRAISASWIARISDSRSAGRTCDQEPNAARAAAIAASASSALPSATSATVDRSAGLMTGARSALAA
jgi:hypothetical protein